jgi:hypothetical protein
MPDSVQILTSGIIDPNHVKCATAAMKVGAIMCMHTRNTIGNELSTAYHKFFYAHSTKTRGRSGCETLLGHLGDVRTTHQDQAYL